MQRIETNAPHNGFRQSLPANHKPAPHCELEQKGKTSPRKVCAWLDAAPTNALLICVFVATSGQRLSLPLGTEPAVVFDITGPYLHVTCQPYHGALAISVRAHVCVCDGACMHAKHPCGHRSECTSVGTAWRLPDRTIYNDNTNTTGLKNPHDHTQQVDTCADLHCALQC